MADHAHSKDITRVTFAVLFIGMLIIGSYLVLSPFLGALIWAAMIVIATWPLMRVVQRRLWGNRRLAVAVMTIILLLVLVVPLWFVVATLAENADTITGWAKAIPAAQVAAPPEWVNKIPFVGVKIAARWRQVAAQDKGELVANIAPYVGRVLQWFASQIGGFGVLFVHFLLTVLLSAILYSRGEVAADGMRGFARRLGGDRGENVCRLTAQAIRAVALGIIVTALVQSCVAGFGLLVAGIPYAVLLTALIFMLGVIQIGPLPVMIPTVIWLYWSGSTGWGTAILVWTVVVCLIDNLLRPFLIKKGADLPLLLIFAGVLGGMLSFGIVGLFVGPVVLAVSYTLVNAWIDERTEEANGSCGV